MPAFHDLVVERLEPLTADATAITLSVPDCLRAAYAFTAGQHLTFRLQVNGVELRRTFSICTAPSTGRLQVALRILPDGVFSRLVQRDLRVGDVLSVMTPAGRFGPSPALPPVSSGSRTYVAIVAGSGITPVMSILTTILQSEPDSQVVLLYGNRTSSSVMFSDSLADLKDLFVDRLQILHVLSRETSASSLLSGRIDQDKIDVLLSWYPKDTVHEWFLCGPSGVVSETTRVLLQADVDPRRIRSEVFFLGDTAPVRPTPRAGLARTRISARLDGRTTTFEMPPSGSILDAVLSHRPDAPFACRGGVCGTCRVRVIEGQVEMVRNFALDQSELDADFRLACQSVPRSATVSVDFDC